jgi:hypothetical protein
VATRADVSPARSNGAVSGVAISIIGRFLVQPEFGRVYDPESSQDRVRRAFARTGFKGNRPQGAWFLIGETPEELSAN